MMEEIERELHQYRREQRNAYAKEYRKTYQVSEEQKRKGRARSIANVNKRRGLLTKQPCETCGDEKVEMHHEDYSEPRDVTWLCRPCHLAHHENVSRLAQDNTTDLNG